MTDHVLQMGRSESATVSIGYRVSIRHLIESIHDEESCTYAYNALIDEDAFLEDENNDINEAFLNCTEQLTKQNTWEETKEYLRQQFDALFYEVLLLPVIPLATTTRWGYNRQGIHGVGSLVGDDFSARLDQLRQTCPPRHTVSWIIRQSGS